MYRIHPGYLAWVLEALAGDSASGKPGGEILNRISVPESIAVPARLALETMLSHAPSSPKQA